MNIQIMSKGLRWLMLVIAIVFLAPTSANAATSQASASATTKVIPSSNTNAGPSVAVQNKIDVAEIQINKTSTATDITVTTPAEPTVPTIPQEIPGVIQTTYTVHISSDGKAIAITKDDKSTFTWNGDTWEDHEFNVWRINLTTKKITFTDKNSDGVYPFRLKFKPNTGKAPGVYLDAYFTMLKDLGDILSKAQDSSQQSQIAGVQATLGKLIDQKFSVTSDTDYGPIDVKMIGNVIYVAVDGGETYAFNTKNKTLTSGFGAISTDAWDGPYKDNLNSYSKYDSKKDKKSEAYNDDLTLMLYYATEALNSQLDTTLKANIQSVITILNQTVKPAPGAITKHR